MNFGIIMIVIGLTGGFCWFIEKIIIALFELVGWKRVELSEKELGAIEEANTKSVSAGSEVLSEILRKRSLDYKSFEFNRANRVLKIK